MDKYCVVRNSFFLRDSVGQVAICSPWYLYQLIFAVTIVMSGIAFLAMPDVSYSVLVRPDGCWDDRHSTRQPRLSWIPQKRNIFWRLWGKILLASPLTSRRDLFGRRWETLCLGCKQLYTLGKLSIFCPALVSFPFSWGKAMFMKHGYASLRLLALSSYDHQRVGLQRLRGTIVSSFLSQFTITQREWIP